MLHTCALRAPDAATTACKSTNSAHQLMVVEKEKEDHEEEMASSCGCLDYCEQRRLPFYSFSTYVRPVS